MKVLFRCNAGKSSGLGHLTRCIALAESFKTHESDCYFLIKCDDNFFINKFLEEEFINKKYMLLDSNIDFDTDAKLICENYKKGFSFLILDHYDHDLIYQNTLKINGLKWAQFDYKASNPIYADVIINANIEAKIKSYQKICSSNTILCVGADFAIVRKIFRSKISFPKKNKILISMGGGELPIEVIKMIKNLVKIKPYEFQILTQDNRLKESLINLSNVSTNFDKKSTVDIYSECEIAIVAGGVTTYELAILNIPKIIIPTTLNQLPNSKAWHSNNFAISFENIKKFEETIEDLGIDNLINKLKLRYTKRSMSINGKGADRITSLIQNILYE